MEMFLLYCWLKIDGILGLAAAAISICIAAIILSYIVHTFAQRAEEHARIKKVRKGFIWALIPFLLITLFVPNKEDIAILVAGHYTIEVAKSPEAQKIVTLMRGEANKLLDEQINKLNPSPNE